MRYFRISFFIGSICLAHLGFAHEIRVRSFKYLHVKPVEVQVKDLSAEGESLEKVSSHIILTASLPRGERIRLSRSPIRFSLPLEQLTINNPKQHETLLIAAEIKRMIEMDLTQVPPKKNLDEEFRARQKSMDAAKEKDREAFRKKIGPFLDEVLKALQPKLIETFRSHCLESIEGWGIVGKWVRDSLRPSGKNVINSYAHFFTMDDVMNESDGIMFPEVFRLVHNKVTPGKKLPTHIRVPLSIPIFSGSNGSREHFAHYGPTVNLNCDDMI